MSPSFRILVALIGLISSPERFLINPAFSLNGMLMSPAGGVAGVPPWGRENADYAPDVITGGGDNILASLPSTPSGPLGIIFALLIIFSILGVRVTYSRKIKVVRVKK